MRRKVALAALSAALAGTAAPAAQAHPNYDFRGFCRLEIATSRNAVRGLSHGTVATTVSASDATTGAPALVPIRVVCRLYVNNTAPGTAILAASGPGAAANAAPFSMKDGGADNVLTLCTEVTVGGEFHETCADVDVHEVS